MPSPKKPSSSSSSDDTVVELRKRKRMISNRESARRSRQRKQQHLDNLTAQINHLKAQNCQILSTCTMTTQQYLNIEAENSILRAQLHELTNYLRSLNDIVSCLTTTTTATVTTSDESDNSEGFGGFDFEIDDGFSVNNNNLPWEFGFEFGNNNCSVMPTIDAFMC
ncbi:hypothetical protein vseg_005004 [Gypsophila vaccaria]